MKLLGRLTGDANLKPSKNRRIKLAKQNTTVRATAAIPPIEASFATLPNPRVAIKVTKKKKTMLKIPMVAVEDNPKSRQVPVLSNPLMVVESMIQIFETVDTIRITQEASQTKPPIKAHLILKELASQEKTPPASLRSDEPYSANISDEGMKKRIAARTYQIIPA